MLSHALRSEAALEKGEGIGYKPNGTGIDRQVSLYSNINDSHGLVAKITLSPLMTS